MVYTSETLSLVPKLSVEAVRILHLGYPNGDEHFTLDDYRHQFSENIAGSPRIENSYRTLVKQAEVDPVTGELTITKSSAIRYLYEHTGLDEYRSAVWWDTFGRDAKQFVQGLPAGMEKFIIDVSGYAISKTAGIPDSPVKGLAHYFWAAFAMVGMTTEAMYEGGVATYNMGKAAKLSGSPELAAHTTFMGMTLALQALLFGRAVSGFGASAGAVAPSLEVASVSAGGEAVAATGSTMIRSVPASSGLSAGAFMMSAVSNTMGKGRKVSVDKSGNGSNGVSTKRLYDALVKSGGNKARAGREVGLSSDQVRYRINAADDKSLLSIFKDRAKRVVSDRELAVVLKASKGNRSRAARRLNLNLKTVSERIRKAGRRSPLHEFKGIRGTGVNQRKISDKMLARALRDHRGNRVKTALNLGITRQTINLRIRHAPRGSDLAKFKKIRGKGGVRKKVDDIKLSKVLDKCGGNMSETGRRVGLHTTTVMKRIRKSGSDSPLFKYKVAWVLKRSEGDTISAARELKISRQQLVDILSLQ